MKNRNKLLKIFRVLLNERVKSSTDKIDQVKFDRSPYFFFNAKGGRKNYYFKIFGLLLVQLHAPINRKQQPKKVRLRLLVLLVRETSSSSSAVSEAKGKETQVIGSNEYGFVKVPKSWSSIP